MFSYITKPQNKGPKLDGTHQVPSVRACKAHINHAKITLFLPENLHYRHRSMTFNFLRKGKMAGGGRDSTFNSSS